MCVDKQAGTSTVFGKNTERVAMLGCCLRPELNHTMMTTLEVNSRLRNRTNDVCYHLIGLVGSHYDSIYFFRFETTNVQSFQLMVDDCLRLGPPGIELRQHQCLIMIDCNLVSKHVLPSATGGVSHSSSSSI